MIASANRGSQWRSRSVFARLKQESGQVFAIFVVMIVALLAMTAFVIDVGHAFYVQRALQAQVDAAATAAAQELPDPAAALATAQEYSGSAGGKNERGNLPNVNTTASTKCLSIARCDPVNAITVEGTATVSTLFAKIVGVDSFEIHATATACSPCSSVPNDIMVVLDRTGSMRGSALANAQEGMRTFLEFMDPELNLVGLAVLPPAPSMGERCDSPRTSNYHDRSAAYTIVGLSNDYLINGGLNHSSNLVSTLDCQEAGGRTAYANALEQAQATLDAQGRPDVDDIIIFLSDGAANIGPDYYPDNSPYRTQPCWQGVWSANAIKARGTHIYSIAYGLGGAENGERCEDSPSITAEEALRQIASDADSFYVTPTRQQLETIFAQIASDLGGARLIDESVV